MIKITESMIEYIENKKGPYSIDEEKLKNLLINFIGKLPNNLSKDKLVGIFEDAVNTWYK